jgi:hypothetical protein
MDLNFYRCDTCTRLHEERVLMKRGSCTCGGKRVNPVCATLIELTWYIVCHPSYLVKALRGE